MDAVFPTDWVTSCSPIVPHLMLYTTNVTPCILFLKYQLHTQFDLLHPDCVWMTCAKGKEMMTSKSNGVICGQKVIVRNMDDGLKWIPIYSVITWEFWPKVETGQGGDVILITFVKEVKCPKISHSSWYQLQHQRHSHWTLMPFYHCLLLQHLMIQCLALKKPSEWNS